MKPQQSGEYFQSLHLSCKKGFLETTNFLNTGKYKHIRIGKTQDLHLETAGNKGSLHHPAESKPACGSHPFTSQCGGLRDR